MDNTVTADAVPLAEKIDLKNIEYTESDFQRFIYDLFDKNGIINDLRAHLRGHIVNVLKTAQTGNVPTCRKNFTQRLEPRFQSLNMLLADYLLRMEFKYTLSVFMSEMPLANMMFDLSKSLLSMGPEDDVSCLHFNESDIWTILNSLGIKLDSESVCNIAHMYKSEGAPLLLCIMRCLLMGDTQELLEADNLSEDSATQSIGNELREERNSNRKSQTACKHHHHCKRCRQREIRLIEKYRRSKSSLTEMFQQLKAVYEAEVEMVKEEEKRKHRHNIAGQLILLQSKKDQLEQSFQARQTELERNVQDKKRFLWGLARNMRSQHAHLARAMHLVRSEGGKLNDKEADLKKQLAEAEATLKKRGDDIRTQISNELTILVKQLEYIKTERNAIAKERLELDSLKKLEYNPIMQEEKQELHLQYEKIGSELSILKKYLETTKSETKNVKESFTNTEIISEPSKISLNNTQVVERYSDSEIPTGLKSAPNQVVNNLKKMKNVNFCQWNVEECPRPTSSASIVEAERRESENALHECSEADAEALRALARQQREHIASLSLQHLRLRTELAEARRTVQELRQRNTAPEARAPEPFYITLQRAGAVPHSSPGGTGGGEQLLALPARAPPVVLPGDTLPFVGVVGERSSDARRHLISQWRAMRRGSPVSGVSKSRPHSPVIRERTSAQRPSSADARIDTTPKNHMSEERQAVLSKFTTKPTRPQENSPSSVLKEARLRLKKLEIEAEAVERSYRQYREGRGRRTNPGTDERQPRQTTPDKLTNEQHTMQEFNTAFTDFTNNCNAHFRNRHTARNLVSPIPHTLTAIGKENRPSSNIQTYLDTPLPEFRKLYRTSQHARAVSHLKSKDLVKDNCEDTEKEKILLQDYKELKREVLLKKKKVTEVELEIQEQDLNQMYNLKETSPKTDLCREDNEVHIESSVVNVEDYNNSNLVMKNDDHGSNDILLFIESSIESHKIPKENMKGSKMISEMTIIIAPDENSQKERNAKIEHGRRSRSRSPEHEAKLTRNDVLEAICNDHNDLSESNSQEAVQDKRQNDSDNDSTKNSVEYPDDFSADVDNYNSFQNADGMMSPTSMPTDDDLFWGNN